MSHTPSLEQHPCQSLPSRRIASSYLLQGSSFLKNPIVEVGANGVILSVGVDSSPDMRSGTEFYSGVLIPGVVNAHTHLELSYMRGQVAPDGGFAAFASRVGELRATLGEDRDMVERAIRRADIEMRNSGVVAAFDIANSADALGVKQGSDIEYHTFVELFGLALTADFTLPPLQGGSSSYTPHSTYSLCEGAMRRIIEQSGDAPLSIHFMESVDEGMLYSGGGGIYELYCRRMGRKMDFLHYGSPAKRIVGLIEPERKVILVHNTCLRQEDIDVIMNHFTTPPTWVISPRSNSHITGLTPPVKLMVDNGLDIAVGTDSLASSPSLSPLDEIALFEDIPLAERLGWVSRGGAQAMGLSHLGEIEVGRRCGLNVLSGIDYQRWQLGEGFKLERLC